MRKPSASEFAELCLRAFSTLRVAFGILFFASLWGMLSGSYYMMPFTLMVFGSVVGWVGCGHVTNAFRVEGEAPAREPEVRPERMAPAPTTAAFRSTVPIAEYKEPRREAKKTVQSAAKPAVDWEQWVGKRLLQIVGVLIVLIGMVVLLKEAFENRWIDELGRLLLAVMVSGGLLVAGDLFRKKYAQWAQTFTGGGLALLYFVVWAAHVFYADILLEKYALAVGPTLAFALYIGITLIGALLTIRYRSQAIAWFTLIGGYLTPMLIDTPQPDAIALAGYLFVLGAGLLLMAKQTSWRPLEIASFLITQFYLFGAVYRADVADVSQNAQLVIAIAFFLLFAVLPLMRHFTLEKPTTRLDVYSMVLLCLAVYAPVRDALEGVPHATALTSLALAGALLAMAVSALKLRSDDDLLVNSYLSGTFLLIALALYAELRWEWVAAGWAPYSLALLFIALKLQRKGPWHCAILLLMGSLAFLALRLPVFSATTETVWRPFVSTWSLQSYVVFASVVGWVTLLKRIPVAFLQNEDRPALTQVLHAVLALTLFVLVTLEATALHWTATLTLSYAYIALAAVAIVAFIMTRVIVWFVLAFALHVFLLAFMFLTGDGTTLSLETSAMPILHAWLPVSLATGALAYGMVFAARRTLPSGEHPSIAPLLWALLLGQLWMHGTVEITHAGSYFDWAEFSTQRLLSAWWALLALGVSVFAKTRRWQIAGMALLAIPEAKDLLRLMDNDATFLETVAWTILPMATAAWGAKRSLSIMRSWSIGLLAATMAADILAGLSASGSGFTHSIWWALASLAMLMLGFALRERAFRRTGMAMFGVTVFKLLLLDFSALETPVRIGASVATGLLMIFASYLYQRFDRTSSTR